MASDYQKVREFHKCMDQPMDEMPVKERLDLFTFRFMLIQEEFKEFVESAKFMHTTIDKINNKESYETAKQEVLKELMDIKYVIDGWCATYGWDADEAFKRVHESNMSKLVDGKPFKNEDGKVQKGPNYKLPDLSDLVNDYIYDPELDDNGLRKDGN
jgi:predicted HAD superfamily Cof-like phosphohydrolase